MSGQGAGKVLVVAEKPSVGRDIARVLGARGQAQGYLFGEAYIVSWAIGHLVTLCEPEEMNPDWAKWRMDALPMLPETLATKVMAKTRAQYQVVRSLMASPDVARIVCATDAGREGELIFRYIYGQAKCKKPVDRLWISSMTDEAIRQGFASLRPATAYDALYLSAKCRSEADWLVGMNASRAFTLRYGALLSVGRVQTPTLHLLVARDRERRAFVPRDYWEVRADFGAYAGLYEDPETRELRVYDEARAQAIRAAVLPGTGEVASVAREHKRLPPPLLFDLTTLQREANRLLGYSAARTLSLAQTLYEARKLITYPRTDSRYLPADMRPKVRQALAALPDEYAQLAAPILAGGAARPGRIYNDQKVTDHHAIVPTGKRPGELAAPERRLFDLIVRRLIAAHYPDYEYESVRIVTRVNAHCFVTSGTTPLSPGWKAVYQEDASGKAGGAKRKREEAPLPAVLEGERHAVKAVALKKQATKPPEAHTDATLLAAMEGAGRLLEDEALRESMKDSGLGTPATRAAVIERLIEVGYAQRQGKSLQSTPKGDQLIAVAPTQLTSAETTGKWERALSTMAKSTAPEAQLRAQRFMESIRRFAGFLVEEAKRGRADVQFEREPARAPRRKRQLQSIGARCPLCKAGMLTENERAFGCSRWREGCRLTIWKDALARQGGPGLSATIVRQLIETGRAELPEGLVTYQVGQAPKWFGTNI